MKKKKVTKKAQRRFILLGTLATLVIAFILISVSSYWVQIYKKHNEQKFLMAELQVLKEQELRLKIEIQKLQDPDYVARYAREKYLFSKDGEIIIQIP